MKLSYDEARKGNHIAHIDDASWNDEPMLKYGYVLGAFLGAEEAEKEHFSDWVWLIGILSNHVAATRAAGRTKQVMGHLVS